MVSASKVCSVTSMTYDPLQLAVQAVWPELTALPAGQAEKDQRHQDG